MNHGLLLSGSVHHVSTLPEMFILSGLGSSVEHRLTPVRAFTLIDQDLVSQVEAKRDIMTDRASSHAQSCVYPISAG